MVSIGTAVMPVSGTAEVAVVAAIPIVIIAYALVVAAIFIALADVTTVVPTVACHSCRTIPRSPVVATVPAIVHAYMLPA